MANLAGVDESNGRKFYLDEPDDLQNGRPLTFILSLHGGGSVGAWREAFIRMPYLRDLLLKTSRTFGISIPFLPAQMMAARSA